MAVFRWHRIFCLPPALQRHFFITARHCFIGPKNEEPGELKIKYHPEQTNKAAVPFEGYMLAKDPDGKEFEDIAIFTIRAITEENEKILRARALRLPHQDDVAQLIKFILQKKQRVRTVGFPSISKNIDYEKQQAVVQPKGFTGFSKGRVK
jgi:hypothetical protein